MIPLLAVHRARVDELDALIQELQRSISALQAEKAVALEPLAAYKYPVLTLPSEVVSEIFRHFLPPDSSPPLQGRFSPSILTKVCKTWERIADATPALWEPISFSGFCKGDLTQAHEWLSKSGSRPLSLEFGGSFLNLSTVIPELVAERARWKRVDFDICSSFLSSMGNGPTPLLQHLELVVDEGWLLKNPNPPTPPTATFRDAPMLRTAVLNSVAAFNIILPWSQLTSLTLLRITPEDWVPVLNLTTNLVHCTLEIEVLYDDFLRPEETVNLLRLESLTVTLGDGMPMELACLGYFVLPALRCLEVPEDFLHPDPIATLKSFISKSSCELLELHIMGERSVHSESYFGELEAIPQIHFERKRWAQRARSMEV
ncbi:hypothetical protein C8R47DRAFT_1170615 [Mycena vitilis]|nr:hypothetical protein C8R47DRAFT_1170615 [Mycena vitilis]